MGSGRLALAVLGGILLLAGIVFSLQGANIIIGSSLMSGNSAYIYVGAVVALIGLALLALSSRGGSRPPPQEATAPAPARSPGPRERRSPSTRRTP